MKKVLYLLLALCLFSACDKGYNIRFRNLYTESMDSVVVGKNKIVFTNIPALSATDYTAISRGQYEAKCVSHSKKRFSISFFISGKGSGNKSIQVDASGQTQLLEN